MKNNLLFIIIFSLVIFGSTGCNVKSNVNEVKNKEEEVTKDIENKEEEVTKDIEKLSQDDDLLLYLAKYNNYNYYKPLVIGNNYSNYKSASVEKHLLYFEGGYIYDINLNAFADKDIKFEDIPLDSKEKYKYKIVETRLQSNDEEIYLKAISEDSSKNEFHMFFQYYSNISNALYVYVGRGNYYYVYDYYYDENVALSIARAEAKSSETKVPYIGMTSSQVKKSTWGTPDKINKDTYSWGTVEQWVYKNRGYIYIRNGVVTSISER